MSQTATEGRASSREQQQEERQRREGEARSVGVGIDELYAAPSSPTAETSALDAQIALHALNSAAEQAMAAVRDLRWIGAAQFLANQNQQVRARTLAEVQRAHKQPRPIRND